MELLTHLAATSYINRNVALIQARHISTEPPITGMSLKVSGTAVLVGLLVFAMACPGLLPGALAAGPTCGGTITASVKLAGSIGPCSGDGIVIGADGVTLNCNGHTLTGSGPASTGIGVKAVGVVGVTIQNCRVSQFQTGILVRSNVSTISMNRSFQNTGDGVRIDSSEFVSVTGNTATGNGGDGFNLTSIIGGFFSSNIALSNAFNGFDIANSTNNIIAKSTSNHNEGSGFFISYGSGNSVLYCNANFNANDFGFAVFGGSSNYLYYDIARNNQQFGFSVLGSHNSLSYDTAIGNGQTGAGMGYIIWTGSSHNSLSNSVALGNKNIGIYIAGDNNYIWHNKTPTSSAQSLAREDGTSGGGTLGTANVWFGNTPLSPPLNTFPAGLP